MPVTGNLPTPVGTPNNFTATVGAPITVALADFSNVSPAEISEYSVGIDWNNNPYNGSPTGLSNADPKLQPDGRGGIEVVAAHLFTAPGTVPITVTLESFDNGAGNNGSIAVTATVQPDPNSNDIVINASQSPLPGRNGQISPLFLAGYADISRLIGAQGANVYFTGKLQFQNSGAASGSIILTDNVNSSLTIVLRSRPPKNRFALTQIGTFKITSASGTYAVAKKISGAMTQSFNGSIFVLHT